MNVHQILMVGGDRRQLYLASALRQDGLQAGEALLSRGAPDLEEITALAAAADAVVLGIPALDAAGMIAAPLCPASISPGPLLEAMRPGSLLLGGMLPSWLTGLADRHQVEAVDLAAREDFAILNAVPTAEGAIELAFTQRESTLDGARCLIIGYGRIGRALLPRLQALHARVAVSARKAADLAWIQAGGAECCRYPLTGEKLSQFDVIFSTVPALMLTGELLGGMRRETLVIDLASRPGGVDFDAAGQMGITALPALSLPGKTAPRSAALVIRDTMYQLFREKGLM